MEKNLYIDASHPNETRVVLKSGNNIEDYEYEGVKNDLIKNNIYLGKVSRIEPSLQAAFVDFGRERHGFLSFNDIQSDYYQLPKSDLEKIKEEEEKMREELSKKVEEIENKNLAEGNLEENDVESAFSPIMRIYKSGKFYLLRTNLKNTKDNQPILRIYDENENILTTTDINNETEIISILEIQGIKFTSRNFQLEIEVKQMMVINNDPIFESCLIKTNTPKKVQPNQEENSIALEHLANNDLENNDLANNDVENNDLETIDNIADNSNDTTDVLEEIEPLPENSLEMDLENQSLEKNDLSNNLDITSNEEIIDISFEELATIPNNDDELTEVDYFNFNLEDDHTVKLRPPNEVYFDLYKEAREKAKQAKKNAILAYLEAKNIRKTYMIDYIDESDGDADFDAEIDDVSESELEGL